MAVALDRLSEAKLDALYWRRFEASHAAGKAQIAAGRGHLTGAQIAALAAEGDALSIESVRLDEEFFAVVREQKDRKAYHGSTKPIPRRKA